MHVLHNYKQVIIHFIQIINIFQKLNKNETQTFIIK